MSELHFNGSFTSPPSHCSPRGQDNATTDTLQNDSSKKSTPSLPKSSPPLQSLDVSPAPCYISTAWFYNNVYRLKSSRSWHQSFIARLVRVSTRSCCNLILVLFFSRPIWAARNILFPFHAPVSYCIMKDPPQLTTKSLCAATTKGEGWAGGWKETGWREGRRGGKDLR